MHLTSAARPTTDPCDYQIPAPVLCSSEPSAKGPASDTASALRPGGEPPAAEEPSADVVRPPTRGLPTLFMESHRAITRAMGVLLLVLTGLLVGTGIGTLGAHVIDAVLPHTSPAP